jgi:hypothetical protein
MSRISRYQSSISKFIKNREYLDIFNDYDKIITISDKTDYTMSILMLTILNNINKKNKESFQGYHAATGIELLFMAVTYMNNINNTDSYKFSAILIVLSNKCIFQNMDVVKRHYMNDQLNTIYKLLTTFVCEKVGIDGLLYSDEIEYIDTGVKQDVIKYATKFNIDVGDIRCIKKEYLDKIVEKRMGTVGELAVNISCIMGGYSEEDVKSASKVGIHFGIMYQIAIDFDNLMEDIINCNDGVSYNYIINCGFHTAYEIFLEHKQRFISEAMRLDIFSVTIREIIDSIELKIDEIIDATSPDMVSEYNIASISQE